MSDAASPTPTIRYETHAPVTVAQFRSLLEASSLGERRPMDDAACMKGMLINSNLVVSAWDGTTLVGIARSVTDFHYCCYLSDLAVDAAHQRQGIGTRLQQLTQEQLGPHCTLILISAPAANDYYPALGFEPSPRCWELPRDRACGQA